MSPAARLTALSTGWNPECRRLLAGVLLAAALAGVAGAVDPKVGRNLANSSFDSNTFIIGESNLTFNINSSGALANCTSGIFAGPVLAVGSVGAFSKTFPLTGPGFDTRGSGIVPGEYKVQNCNKNPNFTYSVFAVEPQLSPRATSYIDKRADRDVAKVAVGTSVVIQAKTNLEMIAGCNVEIEFEDPRGTKKRMDIFEDHALDAKGELSEVVFIDPAQYPLGKYELEVETKQTKCNGLDLEGPEFFIEIAPLELTMEAVPNRVAPREFVTLRGTAPSWENVRVELEDRTQNQSLEYNVGAGKIDKASKLKGNGTAEFSAGRGGDWNIELRFNATGTYTLIANVVPQTLVAGGLNALNITPIRQVIVVGEPQLHLFTERDTYFVGDKFLVKGAAPSGRFVTIAINNKVKATNVTVQVDKSFQYEVDTKLLRLGAGDLLIEAWACDTTLAFDAPVNPTRCYPALETETKPDGLAPRPGVTDRAKFERPDDAVRVSLLRQGFSLDEPAPDLQVPQNGKFNVSGSAPGATLVLFWVFNEKGTTADGKCQSLNLSVTKETNHTFTREFDAKLTEKTGQFNVVAQSPGRDGVYSNGETTPQALACDGDSTTGDLGNKPGSQILAILKDKAQKAGSDDFEVFAMRAFQVVPRQIKFDACSETASGEDLVVRGTTNIRDRISVSIGGPAPARAQPVTPANGTFSASFSTRDLPVGTYAVQADDLGGTREEQNCVVAAARARLSLALLAPASAAEGGNVTVRATLANTGALAATSIRLRFLVDGKEACAANATAGPGESKEAACSFPAGSPGTRAVIVEAVHGGQRVAKEFALAVGPRSAAEGGGAVPEGAPSPAASPRPVPSPAPLRSPGFELAAAAAGLALAVALRRRRR